MNICIIGPGNMGHQHYKAYQQIPDANVICCVHPKLKTINNLPSYNCIESVLKNHEIDIIDICAPTEFHYILAAKALMAGKHTIVEKPLAAHPFQVYMLYALAEENNVQLLPCNPMIFTETFLQMKQFKNPTHGTYTRCARTPNNTSNILMDQHYHFLNCLIELYGRPTFYSISESYDITYEFNNLKFKIIIRNANHYDFSEAGILYRDDTYINLFNKFEHHNSTVTQLTYFLQCAQHNTQPVYIHAQTIYNTIDIIERLEDSIKCQHLSSLMAKPLRTPLEENYAKPSLNTD